MLEFAETILFLAIVIVGIIGSVVIGNKISMWIVNAMYRRKYRK